MIGQFLTGGFQTEGNGVEAVTALGFSEFISFLAGPRKSSSIDSLHGGMYPLSMFESP